MLDFTAALNYMLNLQKNGSDYGLERTAKLLELLGNPEKPLKLIHVAGTNGKGSTVAMIAALLQGANYKVGTFTSPFLENYLEQIQVNRQNISHNDFTNLVARVREAAVKVEALGYSSPTEFELLVAMALLYFVEQKVDYAIIEVGLGGELDATNVILPIVSVITSISYDHMQILGNSLSEIARAKAGIIKPHVPVVVYPEPPVVQEVIYQVAQQKTAPIYQIQDADVKLLRQRNLKQTVRIGDYQITMSLLGEHQMLNLAVALRATELALGQKPLNLSMVEAADLANLQWPGRFEILKHRPLLILDGAHNLDAIKKLKVNLKKSLKYRRLLLIFGVLKDKQVDQMIKEIAPLADQILTLAPQNPRAETSENLAQRIRPFNPHVSAYDNYQTALRAALNQAKSDDLILACGSLYMIGYLRKLISDNQTKVDK